jgi:hypothetical protein
MNVFASARNLTFAAMLAFAAPAVAQPAIQAYAGDWEGVLQAGPQKLRLALHLKTDAGQTIAVLDSLDQGVSMTSTAVKTDNGELGILFIAAGGELKGKLSADGKTIAGSWVQGLALPLTLTRKAGPAHQ